MVLKHTTLNSVNSLLKAENVGAAAVGITCKKKKMHRTIMPQRCFHDFNCGGHKAKVTLLYLYEGQQRSSASEKKKKNHGDVIFQALFSN